MVGLWVLTDYRDIKIFQIGKNEPEMAQHVIFSHTETREVGEQGFFAGMFENS